MIRRVLRGPDTADIGSTARQEFLRDCARQDPDRLEKYRLFEDYYDGDHRTRLLARAKQYLEQTGLPYAENFCETIVDTLLARLAVERFQVDGNDDASVWLTDVAWARNRMDELQGDVHWDAVVKGDGYVIVEYDLDRDMPAIVRQPPEKIKPVYGDDGTLQFIVKTWKTSRVTPTNPTGEKVRRMNLHYPDRIEKYFALADGDTAMWAAHLDREDTLEVEAYDGNTPLLNATGDPIMETVEQWPTPWTMNGQADGEPIGINIFHFAHNARGRHMGRSKLRGVVPQQDAHNKQCVDLFYVMDSQGWKQRWGAGVPEGTNLTVAIGEWVTSTDKDARFGQFDAEDPTRMIATLESGLRRMASRSRTPLHMMIPGTGQLPSGESLKTATAGQVGAARDLHTVFGNRWEDVQRMGHRVQSAFGTAPPPLADDQVIGAVWGDPEDRNEEAEARTLGLHYDMGASQRSVLTRLGYDAEEEAKQRAEEARALAPPAPSFRPDPAEEQDL